MDAGRAFEGGDRERARLLYLKAHELDPTRSDFLVNLGVIYLERRDAVKALSYFRQAQEVNPGDQRIIKTIAYALKGIGDFSEARNYFEDYLRQDPDDSDSKSNLLECLVKLNQIEDAQGYVDVCLTQHPDDFRFWVFKGAVLMAKQEYPAVAAFVEEALDKFPSAKEFHILQVQAYFYLRDFARSKEKAEWLTQNHPDELMGWSMLGLTEAELWNVEGIRQAFETGIAKRPESHELIVNYSSALMRVRLYAEAETVLRRGLIRNPAGAYLHYNLTSVSFFQNKIHQGFCEYEWHWHTDLTSVVIARAYKVWYGENLNGRSLLIFTDQGVGDTIQYSRFIHRLKEKYPTCRIVLALDYKLIELFKSTFPGMLIIDRVSLANGMVAMGTVDYTIAFCSLALPLGVSTTAAIQEIKPKITPSTVKNYRDNPEQIVIGIAWSTKSAKYSYKRTLPLMAFLPLAEIDNVKFINLQYGDTAAERAEAAAQGLNVYHDDTVDSWSDLDGFAAQVKACDLIISIDNSTVHYAGTANVPCWTMLPDAPFWRWGDHGDTTPWYDTMRLFRCADEQPIVEMIPLVKAELQKLRAGDTSVLKPAPFVPNDVPVEPFILVIGDSQYHGDFGRQASSQGLNRLIAGRQPATKYVSVVEIERTIYDELSLPDFDDEERYAWIRYRNPTMFQDVQEAEEIVINGLSNLHGTGNTAMSLLYLAYIAKHKFGQTVHFVNADCFPEGNANLTDPKIVAFYRKVLPLLDDVVVRDEISATLLSNLKIPVRQAKDCLPLAIDSWLEGLNTPLAIDANRVVILPTDEGGAEHAVYFGHLIKGLIQNGFTPVVVYGASFIPDALHQHFISMIEMVSKEMGKKIETIKPQDTHDWLAQMANACCVISGRYHGALAAHLLGIPVLLLPANTPRLDVFAQEYGIEPTIDLKDPASAQKTIVRVVKAQRKVSERVTDIAQLRQGLLPHIDAARRNFNQ